MTTTFSAQVGFRGRSGDTVGLNVDSGWAALQNTDFSMNVDTTFRLRLEVEEQNNKNQVVAGTIEYNLGGAGWNQVTTTSSVLKAVASGQYSDGTATSNLLTASSKTFTAGEGTHDAVPTSVALQNTQTEWEYSLQIVSGDVSNGNTIQVRLIGLNGYTVTPTITVIEVSNPDISGITDAVTLGESQSITPLSIPDVVESDAVTVGDSPTVQVTTPVSDIDITGVSDAVTVADVLPTSYFYNVTVSEEVTVQVVTPAFTPQISEADSVTVGDTPTVSVTSIGELNISEADAVVVGDAPFTGGIYPTVSGTDAVTTGESQDVDIGDLVVSEADSATLAEDPTVQIPVAGELNISEADAVTVAEDPTVLVPVAGQLYVSEADAVTLSDIPSLQSEDLVVSGADGVTLVEDPTVQVAAVGVLYISEADSVTTGDSASITPMLMDDISEADAVTVGESNNVIVTAMGYYYVSEADNVTVGDNAQVSTTAEPVLFVNVSDGASVGDVATTASADLILSESDAVTVADASTTRLGSFIMASDSVTVADATSISIGDLGLGVSDAIAVVDAASVFYTGSYTGMVDWTLNDRDMDWSLRDRDMDWSLEDKPE